MAAKAKYTTVLVIGTVNTFDLSDAIEDLNPDAKVVRAIRPPYYGKRDDYAGLADVRREDGSDVSAWDDHKAQVRESQRAAVIRTHGALIRAAVKAGTPDSVAIIATPTFDVQDFDASIYAEVGAPSTYRDLVNYARRNGVTVRTIGADDSGEELF